MILQSRKGMSLIAILTVVGGISTTVLMYQFSSRSEVTIEQFHRSRVKSMMTIIEGRVRSLAFAPTSYQNCDTTVGASSCQLRPGIFDKLRLTRMPGAVCKPAGTPCGVELKSFAFTSATQRFTATIAYTGTEFPQKIPSGPTIDLTIPVDILQSQTYDCGQLTAGARPVFMGFDNQGKPICRAFKVCGPGQFAAAVETMTIDPICENVPSNPACGPSQYISALRWNGGGTAQAPCTPRKNPYDVWPLTQADPNNPNNPIPPGAYPPYPSVPLGTPVAPTPSLPAGTPSSPGTPVAGPPSPPPPSTPPSPSSPPARRGCVINEYTWGRYCVAWAGTLSYGSTYLTSRVGSGQVQLFCDDGHVSVMYEYCN